MNSVQHYREGERLLEIAGQDGIMNANPAAVDFAMAHFAAALVGATMTLAEHHLLDDDGRALYAATVEG